MIRSAYSKKIRQQHPKCGKTMTEQHHAKTCNINAILAKYQKTGLIDHVTRHQPTYGDVSGADFKHAMDLVADQKTIFQELPSEIRAFYNNDPAQYLDQVTTPEGQQELADHFKPAKTEDKEPEKAPKQPAKQSELLQQEEKPVAKDS